MKKKNVVVIFFSQSASRTQKVAARCKETKEKES